MSLTLCLHLQLGFQNMGTGSMFSMGNNQLADIGDGRVSLASGTID